jgi:lysophospholipase L1-like esterase
MKRLARPKRWFALCGWSALLFSASCAITQAQEFLLKDGETVVFYGDSITAQRLYTRFVEDFVLTRYPDLHIRFVNAGVPGDQVSGGYAGTMAQRVERDVLPFHPAMITVMLGMNDGWWGTESPQIDAAFHKGYDELLNSLRKAAPEATITLIRPSPYDEITHGTEFPEYSRVIDDLANDVSKIEAERHASGDSKVLLADFHQSLIDALERAKAQAPQLAPLIVPDRIHPAEIGHWIMAAQLLSAWHVDPIVSSLTLNAVNAQALDMQRTTVTQLTKTADGLQWTQTDRDLPLPFDFNNAMIPLLLGISDIAKIDRLILRVQSLQHGRYQLLIDGKVISTFSKEELASGINLALYKTPMVDQARDVDSTEYQRIQLDQARFILSADVKEDAASTMAEDKLRQAQDQLAGEIQKKLKPSPHKFELRRQ